MHRTLAQQHRALRGRLAEVEPGIEHDLLRDQPGRFRAPGPFEQERGDLADEIVVVRFRIGDTRPQADVRGDNGRAVLRRDRQVVGIAEPGDVVADDRAGAARGVEHRRAPRVDRDRHVEAPDEGLDRGDHAVELLCLPDLGSGTRLHAPDVEQVGAVVDQRRRAPEERVERPRRAAVVERVRRAVQDPHHQRAPAHVDRRAAESQRREGNDGHAGRQ